jgi:hypothetical protein
MVGVRAPFRSSYEGGQRHLGALTHALDHRTRWAYVGTNLAASRACVRLAPRCRAAREQDPASPGQLKAKNLTPGAGARAAPSPVLGVGSHSLWRVNGHRCLMLFRWGLCTRFRPFAGSWPSGKDRPKAAARVVPWLRALLPHTRRSRYPPGSAQLGGEWSRTKVSGLRRERSFRGRSRPWAPCMTTPSARV